jgi:hypothetical protein
MAEKPATIPNLWPTNLKSDILLPEAIIRTQAGALARMTRGVLEGAVSIGQGGGEEEPYSTIRLDVIAPALDSYAHEILTAYHRHDRVYPVSVRAECYEFPSGSYSQKAPNREREAADDDELFGILREVLHSKEVRSLLLSLIAQSNASVGGPGSAGQAAEGGQPPPVPPPGPVVARPVQPPGARDPGDPSADEPAESNP